ncbi:MAG: hypothetical protein ACRDYY_07700 [Acidimicrobiales bacterium]
MRNFSLVPSATEIVYAQGLQDELVGVTHECDWPQEAMAKRAVTASTLPSAYWKRSRTDGSQCARSGSLLDCRMNSRP